MRESTANLPEIQDERSSKTPPRLGARRHGSSRSRIRLAESSTIRNPRRPELGRSRRSRSSRSRRACTQRTLRRTHPRLQGRSHRRHLASRPLPEMVSHPRGGRRYARPMGGQPMIRAASAIPVIPPPVFLLSPLYLHQKQKNQVSNTFSDSKPWGHYRKM
jgi:hypothetical protein